MVSKTIVLVVAMMTLAAPVAAQSDCFGAIAKFQTVVTSDAETGNLNRSVYDQMQPELSRVAALCRSGQNAQALQALQGLKSRYGYH